MKKEVPFGWACPECNHKEFETLSDGRKQCTKCERIWGKPLWKKYNNPNTSNAKGNFTGKTGRIPKFLG